MLKYSQISFRGVNQNTAKSNRFSEDEVTSSRTSASASFAIVLPKSIRTSKGIKLSTILSRIPVSQFRRPDAKIPALDIWDVLWN